MQFPTIKLDLFFLSNQQHETFNQKSVSCWLMVFYFFNLKHKRYESDPNKLLKQFENWTNSSEIEQNLKPRFVCFSIHATEQ
jgi:hypothetical protein